ncbi:uncharacterized protein [Halyomorpha halys]|uniref:uncharacterized protein n=1 Tax=Halyomorpha halys TaxID=286706 RepID=UPI0006D50BAC|nr:uncharacterized protein LOC106689767 [Halyomorpha halys]
MVSIPRLKQSFCGCTLETSSLIIAWLGVLGTAFQLLLGACLFGVIYDSFRDEVKRGEADTEKIETIMFAFRIIASVVFVIYTASLAIDTMLLVGIYKRNHCLMTPWVILSGVGCSFGILATFITLLSAFSDATLLLVAILQGLGLAFGIYCFLLVYSYYSQVKEERLINDARFKPLGA